MSTSTRATPKQFFELSTGLLNLTSTHLSPNLSMSSRNSSISHESLTSGPYSLAGFGVELDKTIEDRVDEILLSIDGTGTFSDSAFFCLGGQLIATGFFVFLLPFLELMPVFTCNLVGSTE